MRAPTLETLPGRPRDVTNAGWWVDHDDGTVSFVIVRRVESGAPNGTTLAFHGKTEEDALAHYEEWRANQGIKVERAAERRAKWGPEGKGKMS